MDIRARTAKFAGPVVGLVRLTWAASAYRRRRTARRSSWMVASGRQSANHHAIAARAALRFDCNVQRVEPALQVPFGSARSEHAF